MGVDDGLARAAGAVSASPPPMARIAAIAPMVRSASDHDAKLRHVIGFLDASRRHGAPVELLTEPGPTGDLRWDAMLAAAAEVVAREHGLPVPAWASTPERFLDRWWFPVADVLGRLPTGLAVYALTHSPGPFAARGIMLDADTLTSV